jgi:hypothetical protein
MKPVDNINQLFRHAAVRTNPRMDETVFEVVLAAREKTTSEDSTVTRSGIRSVCMRSPITRLAVAAAVLAVVGLGVFEFIGTGGRSGVVWAEVAQRVQASRGVIYRERGETDGDYVITHLSPTQYRSDGFKKGQLWMTMWDNRETAKRVVLLHFQKGYVLENMTLREEDSRKHANYQDPAWWVQQFMTCRYTKLEPKEIDGTLCEGIETTDLALVADHESAYVTDNLVGQHRERLPRSVRGRIPRPRARGRIQQAVHQHRSH